MTYPRSSAPGINFILAWFRNEDSFCSTKLCTDDCHPSTPSTWQVLTNGNSLPTSTILDRCQSIPYQPTKDALNNSSKESARRCKR